MELSRHLPIWILGTLLLVGISTASHSQSSQESEVRILQRLAEERYAEGDFQRAAEIYQEIAGQQSEPAKRANSLFTAAWLMQLAGNQPAALASMTLSLKIAPDQPFETSLYNREFEILYRQALDRARKQRRQESIEKTREAVVAMEEGRDSEARIQLEAATELDPDNPTALYNLALLDLRTGSENAAMADFERVVSLSYKESGTAMAELRAKALTSIGMIYQGQGLLEDAEQSFLEATRAEPSEAVAWSKLGMLRYRDGRFALASTALERAYELNPGDIEITRALARCLVETDRAGAAAAMLRTDLQGRPDDAGSWQELARIEMERGAWTDAASSLEKSIEADPHNAAGVAATSSALLAAVHLEHGDIQAALTAANHAVGLDRSNPEAWTILGRVQMAVGQSAAATASLGRAAELDPGSLERQLSLADALLSGNQLPQAEAAYLRALTLDPTSVEAKDNLETVRDEIANERAIVTGRARARGPMPPKKIGLEFASIDYKELQLRGALVKQVNKKSPAARAGLRKGDLILWIGSYSVLSAKDFFQFLKRSPPGDRLGLEFLRDGRIHEVELVLR